MTLSNEFPNEQPPVNVTTDYCADCGKLVMRNDVSYAIHPDAICQCHVHRTALDCISDAMNS